MVSSEISEQNRVRLERPATGGAVGRLDDGRVVFVRHGLPGELVRVTVTESTSKFSRADAVEILEASPDRVNPPCPYAHPGAWKSSLVTEHLRRIAGVERAVSVIEAPSDPKGSRTRLRCAVDDNGRLALRAARSHDVVALDACWVSSTSLAPAFAASWLGAEEVELRAVGEGDPFAVVRRITPRGTMHELCSLRGEPLEPSTQSRVNVRGHVFSVGPRSFWQSHRDAPMMLLDTVLELAEARADDHVTDLFSGVGLFAVPFANVVGPGGRVTAVESSPYAVRDARQNAEGLRNIKVREWSVTPRSINDSVGEGNVVVLDPPRGGLAKGVAEAMVRRRPRRVVYVSCDAATFARDLKILMAGGYALNELRVFDLFPMTEHVELVASLDLGP